MTTYNTSMDGYYQAEMQYWEDMMNGLPATPPNPNDPAQFAKDYYVTTTALDVNYAVATGAAWTGWVAAQVAADTTRDNAIINAEYQLGVDQANAANVLVTSQIAAEDVYADDMININADYAIAVNEKSADIEGDIVNAETNFELAEHAAAQIAGKAVNLAEKDRAHDYADADETRAEALALEDEDLANDLAVEEEIRQNAYAAGEATWLLDEAAAHIASTSIAAAATSSFLTGLAGADFVYLTTAAPLITTATQAFNNLMDADYVAAFPGNADQAAVSGAWTSFFNAMANAAQTAITTEASAYQAYINGMAADIQTTMNNMAGEATALAGSHGAALVNLVSTVGAAATLHTSQAAAAGVVWVDTVATNVKNSEKAAANAWLVMADAGVDALKNLADDFSNHWNSFAHSYLGAAAAHGTNLINEDRLAATNTSGQLTTLAQGVAAEQHDLNLDALNEWLSAALALSPLDDALVNAWAALESASSIFQASDDHAYTHSAPVSDFASFFPSGASPMSGINHDFDLAANDDEIVMQAALSAVAANQAPALQPPVTAVPGVFGASYHLNDSYFRSNPFGIPCVVCHGVTAQGIVGPPNSFRFPGGAGTLEYYGNLRDTAASGVAAAGISSAAYFGIAALLGPSTAGGGLSAGTIVNANRLAHIFGNPGHNLSGYLGTFGGNQAAAFSALETSTVSTLTRLGVTSGTFQEVVTVSGFQVTVRGRIVDGLVKIGTAFIP